MRVRVRGHERSATDFGDVPETSLVEVREVNQNAHPVARLDQLPACRRQPRTCIRRGWESERDAFRECIGTAPHQTQGAQTRPVEDLQCVELRIDWFGAFEVEN